MTYKYCKPIKLITVIEALLNIDTDRNTIEKIQENYLIRKPLFITDAAKNKALSEFNKRKYFLAYLKKILAHKEKANENTKLNCATFVNYVYRNFFDTDIMKNGIGRSWTGMIMSSDCGFCKSIDEACSIKQKLNFIDKNCKTGDILFFHRQSKNENVQQLKTGIQGIVKFT